MVQTLEDEGGETSVHIMIPVDRRTQLLRLAHSTLRGGHFSHKKTSAVLKKQFTWPGIGRDVQNWCSSCPCCQVAANNAGPKAPLETLPVIQTPFHRIPFDLVGPLPRSNEDTSIC